MSLQRLENRYLIVRRSIGCLVDNWGINALRLPTELRREVVRISRPHGPMWAPVRLKVAFELALHASCDQSFASRPACGLCQGFYSRLSSPQKRTFPIAQHPCRTRNQNYTRTMFFTLIVHSVSQLELCTTSAFSLGFRLTISHARNASSRRASLMAGRPRPAIILSAHCAPEGLA